MASLLRAAPAARQLGRVARPLSAAVAAPPAAVEDFEPGAFGVGFETSTLSNGVVVATTAAGPACCVGVRWGAGGLAGPPSAAFAASAMAAKSANGKSDLAIQRSLELEGSEPFGLVGATASTVAVEALPDGVEAAFAAAAVGAGVGRDAVVAWEFEETKASPLVVHALEAFSSLTHAAVKAAYGPGYAPVADAEALAALEASDVDAWFAAAVANAPATAFGVGVAHSEFAALAEARLGSLAPRGAAASLPVFQAGGLVAVPGTGCAVAVPAPADPAVAVVVAEAIGATLVEGLLVVEGPDKASAEAQLKTLGDVASAKASAAAKIASAGPLETAAFVSEGSDPEKLYAAALSVADDAVKAAHAAATKNAPAVALAA